MKVASIIAAMAAMIALKGCGGAPIPVPDEGGTLAVNCDSSREGGEICLKRKNLTACQEICVDEKGGSAWVATEDAQKYCPLSAALRETHCIEVFTRKQYIIPPPEWLKIQHHFTYYSDVQVSAYVADHEFECLKGLCDDNEYESLKFLQEFLREKK